MPQLLLDGVLWAEPLCSPSDTRCKLSSSSHVPAKNRFALRSEELGLGVLWEQGSSSASHRAVCQHVEHGDEK